jgi:hypothetical protein
VLRLTCSTFSLLCPSLLHFDESIWRHQVCYLPLKLVQHVDPCSMSLCCTYKFSSEPDVSFFNLSHLGIAFATVDVIVLDSDASLNIGYELILYHRYLYQYNLFHFLLPPHFSPCIQTNSGGAAGTRLDSYLGQSSETGNRREMWVL